MIYMYNTVLSAEKKRSEKFLRSYITVARLFYYKAQLSFKLDREHMAGSLCGHISAGRYMYVGKLRMESKPECDVCKKCKNWY